MSGRNSRRYRTNVVLCTQCLVTRREVIPVDLLLVVVISFPTISTKFLFGQWLETGALPVFFWPKTSVPEFNSDRECCWPYLIGRHPFSSIFGQKRSDAPDYSTLFSFHPFLAVLCSLPVGYSNRPPRNTRYPSLSCLL